MTAMRNPDRAAMEESLARRRIKVAGDAERRAERGARRAERRDAIAALGRRLRPVAPLLVVTSFAGYGQVSYGVHAYSPETWPLLPRMLIAVGVAVGVESIALYVQWHAHDALMMKATATAARLRRWSYLIALGVAAVNYSHFSDGLRPTPSAVVFAVFSAAGPWLWGLHTRRAQQIQLTREGHVDSTGATFSAERWRAFPIRTWGARRWSIDHGVTNPAAAWQGFNAERDRAAELGVGRGGPRATADELLAQGAGWPTLKRELEISEHQARQLVKAYRGRANKDDEGTAS